MEPKVWATSENGTINYQLLTAKYLEDSLNLMKTYYVKDENVCKAVSFAENPKAVESFLSRLKNMAKQGITVIAIDKTLDKVIGVSFNRLFVKNVCDTKPRHIESEVEAVAKFSNFIESKVNIFEKYQIDCYVEIMSVSISPDYRGKGIAKKLISVSIEFCKSLKNGENFQESFDGQEQNLKPAPEAVVSVFSSFITQKIGKQLGFEIIATANYDETYGPRGATFSSVLGEDNTKCATFEYLQL